jgi:hypothetical protein
MALSQAEVAAKLNAEYVAGNLIVGERSDRVFVGKTSQDGVFTITEAGEALLAALETAKPASKKAAKTEAAE